MASKIVVPGNSELHLNLLKICRLEGRVLAGAVERAVASHPCTPRVGAAPAVLSSHSSLESHSPNVHLDAISRAKSVYCHGTLLETVQHAHIFDDCKDFVDMPMKKDPEVVLQEFHALQQQWQGRGGDALSSDEKEALRQFIFTHFHAPGSELLPTKLEDFTLFPSLLGHIANDELRQWAWRVNKIWSILGRQVAPEVVRDPQRFSLIYSKHPLVIPGGRFRETYYWDNYWIVEGLLASDMNQTAQGVVQNLLDQCDAYGFVPNGGRIYYLSRSQPPMLSEMVRAVYSHCAGDVSRGSNERHESLDFLRAAFPVLEKEYRFWMHGDRAVRVKTQIGNENSVFSYTYEHVLNRYYSDEDTPRPESYREDIETAHHTTGGQGCPKPTYRHIRAGAETGWDYSSRWFHDHQNLSTIRTCDILPVDLNSILYRFEKNMQLFSDVLGEAEGSAAAAKEDYLQKMRYYGEQAEKRKDAIAKVLWDPESNCWKDAWMESDTGRVSHRSEVTSVSNFLPLWADAYDRECTDLNAVLHSLNSSGLILPGGVTTTTQESGEQWDWPNAWAPLQAMLIEGLERAGTADARFLAYTLAEKWIHNCFSAFQPPSPDNDSAWHLYMNDSPPAQRRNEDTTKPNSSSTVAVQSSAGVDAAYMFEKYDCREAGKCGGGGEYKPQTGFGWTNGVALQLLKKYGQIMWTPQSANMSVMIALEESLASGDLKEERPRRDSVHCVDVTAIDTSDEIRVGEAAGTTPVASVLVESPLTERDGELIVTVDCS